MDKYLSLIYLRTLFEREVKRIEPYKARRKLTRNLNKRVDYKKSLVRTYNNIVTFFDPIRKAAQLEEQINIQSIVVEHLAKLKEAFCILKLEYEFPKKIFESIDFDRISQDWSDLDSLATDGDDCDDEDDDKSTDSTSQDKVIDNNTTNTNAKEQGEPSKQSTPETTDKTNNIQTNNLQSNEQENQTNMAQKPEDFMALAHRTINYKFSGDPLALDSFVDAIKLLTSLCKQENKEICIQFIMTKLEGEAREAIETEPTSTDEIITQLKEHIKPESSKVIEGRILALRSDKTNLITFSQRAEELAEQYRRSLCNEGYSKAKAKQLSIERTVDLCRRSARNDQVKSIIAATTFTEPKEVIAKMIVEINNVKWDRSVTNKKQNNFHKKNSNKYKSNNGQSYKNNSGASNSQNSNTNKQNNGNGNGNRHGRNNYSNGNGNSRTYHNSNNSNNGRRQNEQSLRYYSGNETTPGNGGQASGESQ